MRRSAMRTLERERMSQLQITEDNWHAVLRSSATRYMERSKTKGVNIVVTEGNGSPRIRGGRGNGTLLVPIGWTIRRMPSLGAFLTAKVLIGELKLRAVHGYCANAEATWQNW